MVVLAHNQTKHGYHGTAVYGLWASMVGRCEIQTKSQYKYYGARGIKVCDEWRENPKEFCEWALANGYKAGMELDRIDVNDNYFPGNCQFITHKENCAPRKRRLRVNNRTGERNVNPTRHGTYEAWAYINGKQKYIGTFKTVTEAAQARDECEVIGTIYGEGGKH